MTCQPSLLTCKRFNAEIVAKKGISGNICKALIKVFIVNQYFFFFFLYSFHYFLTLHRNFFHEFGFTRFFNSPKNLVPIRLMECLDLFCDPETLSEKVR